MFIKKFYNIRSIRKLYKILAIVGIALLLLCIYFLLHSNSIYESFIIGTSGLMFLFVSFYACYKEKKESQLSPYKFLTIFNTGGCILFLSWAIFLYCQHSAAGTIFLIISIFLAVVVYLKKYVNKIGKGNVMELIEKYDKKD